MAASRRVLITGLGMITPLGSGRELTWRRLIAGERAARWLTPPVQDRGLWPDNSAGASAPVPLPRVLDTCGAASSHLTEPVIRLAVDAAFEAVQDAGLELNGLDRNRIGCVIGTSKGAIQSLGENCRNPHSPVAGCPWDMVGPNGAAVSVAAAFDLRGPLLCPVTACATGLSSLVRGAELIRDNVCDVVLAGSSDASLTPAVLATFRRLGVLAKGFKDPATAVRPFDAERQGFLVGEGSAMFVLESAEHASARGQRGYAEWLNGGGLCDAASLTQLDLEPAALVRLILDTLRRSGVAANEVELISVHGTATELNDRVEARAIHTALGDAAQDVSCMSLKGAIGHLLGAAGSVEFGAMLLALRDGVVPPAVNLEHLDPACQLRFARGAATHRRMSIGLKLSLGFGGHLVAGIVRRCL